MKAEQQLKATRIADSDNLNPGKYERLTDCAKRLGKIRKEVWHRYGSINAINVNPREVRDKWVAQGREFGVPARLWKATLKDTLDSICAYREAVKQKIKRKIFEKTKDNKERKRLYTLLKYNRWRSDSWLCRQMRKHYKHGQTDVDYQIVLDTQCYDTELLRGRTWLAVTSLKPRKRIKIPLNTNQPPTGTIRLILRNGIVSVHYAVDASAACSIRPCGEATVGIDKGYTEVATDSDGNRYGEGLGELLSAESDHLKTKYQRRNKLKAIGEAKPHKAQNIEKNNLGRKKLDERKRQQTANVRNKVFKAVHSLVDKAGFTVCEDLSFAQKSKKKYGKNQTRRLSGWVKGIIKEALENVSQRRGSTLVLVNAAYTSQMDSRHGVLLGLRNGKKFYCYDGVVLEAEGNAARNVLARNNDTEIRLNTPYQQVKSILLKRTERFKSRLGLLNQDTSCNAEQLL
jgi:IS605 OrfB family transposase